MFDRVRRSEFDNPVHLAIANDGNNCNHDNHCSNCGLDFGRGGIH